ncbi:MAG: dTMP kinase [Candidatus Eremiobacteraeota bacterium]|nr:dTMP kinase [Candidatus Eremiobacteraeota bacterium]
MFVTVEGIEGSGKSTLLRGLAEWLRSIGREVVLTREPGGTPIGDAIRDLFLDRGMAITALTEAMLVNAARAQHVNDVIRPELSAGKIVLSDRFVDSTIAYQGYGRGVDLQVLAFTCSTSTGGLQPDLTLLIDVPVDVSRRRIEGKGSDRLEAENDAFHQRVRAGFLEIARASARHHVLDGTLGTQELLASAKAVLMPSLWAAPT